jgi:uncharacterized SAM-binding protein YcdF (DUF218 family)
MPMSWIVIALAASFFIKRWTKKLRLASLIILLFFGNTVILNEVKLLWDTPITLDQDLDHYKYAVVLGGYAYYSPENDRIAFAKSGDRLFQGLRLLKSDYVDQLILSGGSGYVLFPELKESLYTGSYLEAIDISADEVILESESRNTRENALYTYNLVKENGYENEPIILITSAYHMRRAIATFEKLGLNVIPYPAEPSFSERNYTIDTMILPSASALNEWNVLFHEWMGYVSYSLSGYI